MMKKKKIKFVSGLVLGLFLYLLLPLSVQAYNYIEDSCVNEGKCMLVCSYQEGYKPDDRTFERYISLYYHYSGQWSLKWEGTNTDRITHTKGPDLYNSIFSNKGENVYLGTYIEEGSFSCPKYAYLDLSELLSDNEVCFDNDYKSCATNFSNIGTSFGTDSKKFLSTVKVYDVMNEVQRYFDTWTFGDISCDDLATKKIDVETEIAKKINQDFQKNFLKNQVIPTFIINSSIYKNAAKTAIASLNQKKQQCIQEIEKQQKEGKITEEEAKKKKETISDIDDKKVSKNIQAALDEIRYKNEATLDGLNQQIGCEVLFASKEEGSVFWIIQRILLYIRIAGPILVVLLSAVDFIKVVFSSEDDSMKKAQKKFMIRLIGALALFLIPLLVSFLLQLIGNIEVCTP